jgi:hypothetical protein
MNTEINKKAKSAIKGIVKKPSHSSCFEVHETPEVQGLMLSGMIL